MRGAPDLGAEAAVGGDPLTVQIPTPAKDGRRGGGRWEDIGGLTPSQPNPTPSETAGGG